MPPPSQLRGIDWLYRPILVTGAPWLLHRAADEAAVLPSLLAGILALYAASWLALVGQPRGTLHRYVGFVPLAAESLLILAIVVFLCIPGSVWIRLNRRARAMLCAVLLTPATLPVPVFLWFIVASLAALGNSPFTHPPRTAIALAASWYGLAAIALAAILNLALALHRLSRMTFPDDGNICPHCHYSLRGLPRESPCPECGSAQRAPRA